MTKLKRYDFLDSLRGLTIVSMILYHFVWDLVFIFGQDLVWFKTGFSYIWQQSICWCFILLSGFCFNLSSRKLRRGLIVFGCGAGVSIVTGVFMPDEIIIFGILTFIGSAMLIMTFLQKFIQKVPARLGAIVSFILFAFSKNITLGYLGFFGIKLIYLPNILYANVVSTYFGFLSDDFYSADYFPIFPWIFLFVCGFFIGKLFLHNNLLDKIQFKSNKILAQIGKYSLWIYLAHQPLIYGILYLIYM